MFVPFARSPDYLVNSMNKTTLIHEITKLPLPDQVALVQEIWDQIAEKNPVLPLSDKQISELERRSAELQADNRSTLWRLISRSYANFQRLKNFGL